MTALQTVLEKPASAPPPPSAAAAPAPSAAADSALAKREELRAKVAGYANLPENWDDNGGEAPAQIDIDNALAFIPHIPERAMRTVQVCPTGDGEVVFSWNDYAAKHFFTVLFDDGGEIAYVGDLPCGRGVGEAEIQYDRAAGPPAELLRFLSGLTF